jgi:hypothetical protein
MKQDNQPMYLTLSLPSGRVGSDLKDAIKKLARGNGRSVSNQCVRILQDHLREMGKLPLCQDSEGVGG